MRLRLLLPLLLLLARSASAQIVGEKPTVVFPDPSKFARGIFVEGDTGALIYLGKIGQFAAPGPSFGVRAGYDIFRWLSAMAHVDAITSSATLPPPYTGQSFQMYLYAAEARLSLQIRRVGLYLGGGAGVAQLSSNIFEAPGVALVPAGRHLSFTVVGSGGIDLHTLNRHFSVGLAGDFLFMGQFSGSMAVNVAAYLRYTR